MAILSAVLAPLVGLAFVVVALVRSGERAPVLVYAFVLTYILQLLTLRAMLAMHTRSRSSRAKQLVALLCSPPEPGRESCPVTDGDTGQPTGLGGYLFVMAVMSFFAFMLVNVNASRTLDVDAGTLAADARWALAVTGIYWLQSLAAQTLVIDFAAPATVNYGYNSGEVPVLAFAVLTAGVAVMIRQGMGAGASGWVVLGPLLAWRTLADMATAVKLAKRRSSFPSAKMRGG